MKFNYMFIHLANQQSYMIVTLRQPIKETNSVRQQHGQNRAENQL